jgi:hypothetical protein
MSTLFCLSIGKLFLSSILYHINVYIGQDENCRKQQLLVLQTRVNEEITVSASDIVLLVSAATCFSLVNKLPSGLYTKYHIEEFNIQWFLGIVKILVLFSHFNCIE